jgi:excisionase family DNA binding protein
VTVNRSTPIADLPELLRAEEAAAWLGISKGTLYELIRRGDIPHISIGRLVRIPRAALVAKVTEASARGAQ